jgi:hypothetical protein
MKKGAAKLQWAGISAQRPELRFNEPKKTGARSAAKSGKKWVSTLWASVAQYSFKLVISCGIVRSVSASRTILQHNFL